MITFDLEHPSVLVPCYYLQRRHGVVARVLSLAADEAQEAIVAKVEEAITPRTRMVFLNTEEEEVDLLLEDVKELARK